MEVLTDFFDKLTQLFPAAVVPTEGVTTVVAIVLAVFGLCNCFFGFKLFRFWIAVTGFFVGFALGFVITGLLVTGENALAISIIVGVVVAIIGALLAYKMYRIGLFIWAFCITCGGVFSAIPQNVLLKIVLGVVLGLIAGVLVMKYRYVWVIISTSVTGGLSAAAWILSLFNNPIPWLVYVIGAVLAVCGLLLQFSTGKNNKHALD